MEIYVCGGAVRDVLLGYVPKDLDYVVVNSSHKDMISGGYKQVGSSFPVYLHPITGDEYALARSEVKTGVGYSGFATRTNGVSLHDDLMRRDLTINSLAVPLDWWDDFVKTKSTALVIDPFDGLHDLNNKLLRHTSEAFRDDPIRSLRLARFSGRYSEFGIFADTIALARDVVAELDFVPSERIWAEISKGLQEPGFMRMFQVLEVIKAFDIKSLHPLKSYAAYGMVSNNTSLNTIQRFALVAHGFNSPAHYSSMSVPIEFSRFSTLFNNAKVNAPNYQTNTSGEEKVHFMTQIRAFNEYDTITKQLCEIFSLGEWWNQERFESDVQKALTVDTSHIASLYKDGKQIANAIKQARIEALTNNNT